MCWSTSDFTLFSVLSVDCASKSAAGEIALVNVTPPHLKMIHVGRWQDIICGCVKICKRYVNCWWGWWAERRSRDYLHSRMLLYKEAKAARRWKGIFYECQFKANQSLPKPLFLFFFLKPNQSWAPSRYKTDLLDSGVEKSQTNAAIRLIRTSDHRDVLCVIVEGRGREGALSGCLEDLSGWDEKTDTVMNLTCAFQANLRKQVPVSSLWMRNNRGQNRWV